jgi:hypothetical protein
MIHCDDLNDEQLDGIACVLCGRTDGAMTPTGTGPRGQLFAHVPNCPPTTIRAPQLGKAMGARSERQFDHAEFTG